MTRIRNVSPFGDLIIAGHGVVKAGDVIDTDDKSLIDSPNFEAVASKSSEGKK
ncbi:MAG TPA: hypothetical protein VFH56_07335 [Acidimicrobiales bacterium]|nr:hypothetical protein [Acidimicrobiales bacterium]